MGNRKIKKILIANRGEIACRIIWTCREMGIQTVAVHSEADREALHVRFADEAVCIGKPPSTESYLNIPAIISAAEITNVDAIHPGYGFLAESETFATICEDCNINFIGPKPKIIKRMGDKVEARRTMEAAGVPILPGSSKTIADADEAKRIAKEIGFPLIIKAAAGGGGRGMRIVRKETELSSQLEMACSEAQSAFNNDSVYIEKYIERPRHVEVQVLADAHGECIHLGERECTIQRRHQKLLEEAPSPVITDEMREEMGNVAVKACRDIGYSNAGTLEFLIDESGTFYFMEMNTRIQVEHPVTEMVTLADIVYNQIRIAKGEKLNYTQDDVRIVGHSIECRINAEDPEKFTPSPGKIAAFNIPGGPGVRVDTAIYPNYIVPPYYDSMIAKLIVHARTREGAIRRMRRALEVMVVEGIKTTIPLHQKIMKDERFQKGDFSTKFMEEFMEMENLKGKLKMSAEN